MENKNNFKCNSSLKRMSDFLIKNDIKPAQLGAKITICIINNEIIVSPTSIQMIHVEYNRGVEDRAVLNFNLQLT